MKKRILILDEARGFFIILMVLYHLAYDIVFIFGKKVPSSVLYTMMFQPIIPLGFCIITGISCTLSHKNFRRGSVIFLYGLSVCAVTYIFMRSQFVVFGVLSMLGVSVMLTGIIDRFMRNIPPYTGAAVCAALFCGLYYFIYKMPVPQWISLSMLYKTGFLFIIGFPKPGFASADYFPILPWCFAVFFGFFIGRIILVSPPEWFYKPHCPPLGRTGRYSMPIYLIHQPVLYGILFLLLKYPFAV